MDRALALARARLGRTAPNPAVGCVITRTGVIVGEGATGEGGRPHAEERALDAAGDRARSATAYVTLEPCARRSSGAPSCSARLIEAGVRRVVIACDDPHPNAGGAGVALMRDAGLTVEAGLRQAEAEELNAGFFQVVRAGRPLLAIDADGSVYDAVLDEPPSATPQARLRDLAAQGVTRACIPPHSAHADAWRATD